MIGLYISSGICLYVLIILLILLVIFRNIILNIIQSKNDILPLSAPQFIITSTVLSSGEQNDYTDIQQFPNVVPILPEPIVIPSPPLTITECSQTNNFWENGCNLNKNSYGINKSDLQLQCQYLNGFWKNYNNLSFCDNKKDIYGNIKTDDQYQCNNGGYYWGYSGCNTSLDIYGNPVNIDKIKN